MAPPNKPAHLARKVVKRQKKFVRHQSDRKICVKESWRKQRGIDSRVRRKFKGSGVVQPNIGYGTNKRHRHVLPNGFLKCKVSTVADVEMLLLGNRTYCAEIAHNVSAKKRTDIITRARQLDVQVINAGSKSKTEEDE